MMRQEKADSKTMKSMPKGLTQKSVGECATGKAHAQRELSRSTSNGGSLGKTRSRTNSASNGASGKGDHPKAAPKSGKKK